MNKYRAIKHEADGIKFDSTLEYIFYKDYLKPASLADKSKLECHVPYDLVVNGEKIGKYIADFVVTTRDKRKIVYECKGVFAPGAKAKLRLFEAIHGIPVMIVRSLSQIEALRKYNKWNKIP